MSDLVGNPEDQFSGVTVLCPHALHLTLEKCLKGVETCLHYSILIFTKSGTVKEKLKII